MVDEKIKSRSRIHAFQVGDVSFLFRQDTMSYMTRDSEQVRLTESIGNVTAIQFCEASTIISLLIIDVCSARQRPAQRAPECFEWMRDVTLEVHF